MHFKRTGKTVFGVDLNAAEEKVLRKKVMEVEAEFDRKNSIALDSVFLWHAYTKLNLEPDGLKEFYFSLVPEVDKLIRHYELGDEDSAWICVHKLKDAGMDIEKWFDEIKV